jgi:8-oxo-dGTP pyrophosphatase MutT (NUDIX family)
MLWTPSNVRAILQNTRRRPAPHDAGREGLIPAAVLVPLVTIHTDTHLLLTRRTDTVETHKGHIAFPGGMVDEDDRDRIATALRETKEELGIAADEIETLGSLDDLATPTGFVITPIVGLLRRVPEMSPNAAEVAEAFFVPLSFLSNPHNCRRETRITEFGPRETWHYDYHGRVIWGATAAIIHDLMLLLQPPPTGS